MVRAIRVAGLMAAIFGVIITVAVVGTEEDDDYEYCAVAVRSPDANVWDDDLFEFVLGGEDTCGP